MEGNQKPRKESRTYSLFRWKKREPASSAQTTANQSAEGAPAKSTESADTQRTKNRYKDAVKLLQDAIKAHGGEQWGNLHISKLGDGINEFNDSQLRKQIDETLKVMNVSVEDQDALGKCRHIIQCMFTALSPLAKNFLTIASLASNVSGSLIHFDDVCADPGPKSLWIALQWTSFTYYRIIHINDIRPR